jgi:enoyl-CoA hydratase/carnithine racemase
MAMVTSRESGPKFETVLFETKGPIAYITLNRPEKLNAASDQLVEDVNDALFEFDADPALHVAIIAGAGRAFCSGADVRQRQLRSPEEMRRLGGPAGRRSRDNGLADTVNWKPVIAAVHGYALGLGYSLAQSCDLVVAAEGTKFQIREVQRGLGGAQHWVATWFWTGSRFANEVALTGRMFDAGEALQHGMVNRVVPEAKRIATAEALAAEIAENPPLAVRANVRVMRWFVNEMQRQSRLYTQGRGLHLTEDFRESAEAFVAKRKPVFKGK